MKTASKGTPSARMGSHRRLRHLAGGRQATPSSEPAALPDQRDRGGGVSFSHVRWLAIGAPLVFLTILWALLHTVLFDLHEFPGIVLTFAVAAIGVVAFSFAIFATIRRLERQILEQNAHLEALTEIAQASTRNLRLEALLELTLPRVAEVLGAEGAAISIYDAGREEVVAGATLGLSEALVSEIARQELPADSAGREVDGAGGASAPQLAVGGTAGELAHSEGIGSLLGLPLLADGDTRAVLAIGRGDGRPFSPADHDLLVDIGRQLSLALRNALLFERAERHNRELAALLSVARATTSSLELSELLAESLEAILEVTLAETAELWLTAESDGLRLVTRRGFALEAFGERDEFAWGEGLPGLAAQSGAPIVVHDLASDPRFLRGQVTRLGIDSFLALPLIHGRQTVGVLTVAARDSAAFTQESERRLLEGIGQQLAVAIENAQLQARVLDRAVLEERERIARELHDGLAQVLGYINTQTLAVKKLLSSNRLEEADAQLAALETTARAVYGNVREAILGLRVSPEPDGDFRAALESYLRDFAQMAKIDVRLEASESASRAELPAASEIQLMRILQEALSNVRKHAEATHATVSLDVTEGALTATVRDDGVGFAQGEAVRSSGWPHFGLQTMRERAEAIGGRFELVSTPGGGTSVSVRIPLTEAPEAGA